MCRTLNCDPEDIEAWRQNRKMVRRVQEKLQERAVYLTAKILDKMAKKAETDVQAARFLAQVGTVLPVGGVSFQQTNIVDARQSGLSWSINEFNAQFRQRIKDGLLQRFQLGEGTGNAQDAAFTEETAPSNDQGEVRREDRASHDPGH